MIELKTGILNGKKIGYTSETQFIIQYAKGRKQKYKTKYVIKGNLAQAVALYNGINIGYGYKKRLFAPALNKPILARQFSV